MNKKLKVIQLIDSLNPGGAEMMAVNIANELAKEAGIASHLCATRLEGDLKAKIENTVEYLFLNKKSTFDIKAIRKLNNYIKRHKISIVHAHSSSYFIGFLVKLLNPKLSLIWHNHFGDSINLPFKNRVILTIASFKFKHIISVNTQLNLWAQKHLKVKNNWYLPNFASLNDTMIETTFLKGADKKRILILANLRAEKDHLNLLKAFKSLHHTYSDWTLHLVGADLQDKYAAKIKEYIASKKLRNHVFLYGSCHDTAHILKQATIGVLASKSEGLPVALLEYGLAKLPVVVTDVGECASVVTHEISGTVVVPNNEEALAKALEALVLDKKMRTVLSTALYETVQMKYSRSNFIHTLIAIYNLD